MDLPKKLDGYDIGERIGRGGFATVYRAFEKTTKKQVAIKTIDRDLIIKKGLQKRVIDEVKLHNRLSHRSIVEVLTYFEDIKYVCIVLEYCRYRDLGKFLHAHLRSTISEPEASTVGKQVLSAVIYLHKHGIIHRDLKLPNILIKERNEIKLADFGLATKISFPSEKHMTMCGTPNYISPEVAAESPHGTPVDVWGVGALLYTLLIGRGPFEDSTVKSTLSKITTEPVRIPGNISEYANDLLIRLLEKNQARRISAVEAEQHSFFRVYRETPLSCDTRLSCDVTQDSGLGMCAHCSRLEESSRTWASKKYTSEGSLHSQLSYRSQPASQRSTSRPSLRSIPSSYSQHADIHAQSQPFTDRSGNSSIRQQRSRASIHTDSILQTTSCEPLDIQRLPPSTSINEIEGTGCYIGENRHVTLVKSRNNRLKCWSVSTTSIMNVYTIPGGRLSHTPPEPPPNVEQYSLNQLPRKLLPRYNHLVSFVKSVKAKIIKLTFFAHDATCNLMESLEDFVVVFHSGLTIERHGGNVQISRSGKVQLDCPWQKLPEYSGLEICRFLELHEMCMNHERYLETSTTAGDSSFPAQYGKARPK